MLRKLLICGLVSGACGGLVATGVASLVGEPAIGRAISYEEGADNAAPGHTHEEPALVSRGVQESAGLLTASVVYGVALGGVFALVFAVAYGRVGSAAPRATAYRLAAAAFVVVFLVPFVKYPASPPGASDPATITRRTLLYLTMIAIAALAAIAAARIRPALARRWDGHAATVCAGLAFLVIVVVGALALPGVDEVPADFPAATLWQFREASVAMQAALWGTIGLAFGPVAQRVMSGQPAVPRRTARRPATAVE